MNVTLRQIEGFLAAADTLSFSQAAKRLHITQSAFSHLIREFESALNVRLFDRNTRAVSLTKVGASLVPKMRQGVFAVEHACMAAHSVNQLDTGHVSLGTLPSLAAGYVTQALGDLRKEHPGITVSLHEKQNIELLNSVTRGDIEFAICAEATATSELMFELIYTEELVLLVPRGHALATRKRHKWGALRDMPLIMPAQHTSIRQSVSEALEANGVKLLPSFEVGGFNTSISMVRAGLGATIMPLTALAEMNLDGVSTCQLTNPKVLRRIVICRRNDRTMSPAASRIVKLFQARVSTASH